MNDYVKLQFCSPVPVYESCSTKNSSWELNLVAVLLSSYEIVPCLYLVTFSMCNDCMPALIPSFLKSLIYFKYRCECDANWLLITMNFGRHKIVIVEGNYLLLDEDVWTEIRDLFDEKWWVCRLCNYNSHLPSFFGIPSSSLNFGVKIVVSNGQNYVLRFIDINIDLSMQRVLKRHIATGLL